MNDSVIYAHDEHDSQTIFSHQQTAFYSYPYPSYKKRSQTLRKLLQLVITNKQAICEAISSDFGYRSIYETKLLELYPVISAIKYNLRHLKLWMTPERVRLSWQSGLAKAKLWPQPLGVVGIVAPWNYPLYLSIVPLVAAIAAGNNVMLKLSERTPNFAKFLHQLFIDNFSEDEIAVINGGPNIAKVFVRLPFNHLFFTGSSEKGQVVMHFG